MGSPTRCEFCNDLLLGRLVYNEEPDGQKFGYFCSPKCRHGAHDAGIRGTPHRGFLSRLMKTEQQFLANRERKLAFEQAILEGWMAPDGRFQRYHFECPSCAHTWYTWTTNKHKCAKCGTKKNTWTWTIDLQSVQLLVRVLYQQRTQGSESRSGDTLLAKSLKHFLGVGRGSAQSSDELPRQTATPVHMPIAFDSQCPNCQKINAQHEALLHSIVTCAACHTEYRNGGDASDPLQGYPVSDAGHASDSVKACTSTDAMAEVSADTERPREEEQPSPTTISASDVARLEALYKRHLTETELQIIDAFQSVPAGGALYRYPDIPEKKLANAKNAYAKLRPDEAILCLLDSTVFGSAKEGLLLTCDGVYWKNTFVSGERRKYKQVPKKINVDKPHLVMGEDKVFLLGISDEQTQSLAEFVKRAAAISRATGQEPTKQPKQQREKMQSKPHVEERKELQESRQVAARSHDAHSATNMASGGVTSLDSLVIQAFSMVQIVDKSLFRPPEVPQKKLDNAKSSFANVPSDETILCLYDSTVWGSAKDGAVFTTRGIYWRNYLESPQHISYSEIDPNIVNVKKYDLYIDKERFASLSAVSEQQARFLVEFVRSAATIVSDYDHAGAQAVPVMQVSESAPATPVCAEGEHLTPRKKAEQKADEELKKLAAAHAAEILTDEEYATKKAAIDARTDEYEVQFVVEEKASKLKDALAAGILDQAEYEAKVADLAGRGRDLGGITGRIRASCLRDAKKFPRED